MPTQKTAPFSNVISFVSGLMTTFYTIASAVSRPVNGLLTDKLTRRIVMAVGCGLFAVVVFRKWKPTAL